MMNISQIKTLLMGVSGGAATSFTDTVATQVDHHSAIIDLLLKMIIGVVTLWGLIKHNKDKKVS